MSTSPVWLLARLKARNDARLLGVELDERKILTCLSRGVEVIHADLNKGLPAFANGEFDTVVLSQTLQTVFDVEGVLTEMLRIGKTCIVSIPNFGYAPLRRMLAEQGRAPKSSGVLHYEWYNTPNVHLCTVKDFRLLCDEQKLRVGS